jgi:hypothetical protein
METSRSSNVPGNPYITSKTVVMDPGQSYQQSALSTQTEDPYGNVLTTAQYDYITTTRRRRGARLYEHLSELIGVCGAVHFQRAAHVDAERGRRQ